MTDLLRLVRKGSLNIDGGLTVADVCEVRGEVHNALDVTVNFLECGYVLLHRTEV